MPDLSSVLQNNMSIYLLECTVPSYSVCLKFCLTLPSKPVLPSDFSVHFGDAVRLPAWNPGTLGGPYNKFSYPRPGILLLSYKYWPLLPSWLPFSSLSGA